jgi:cobalt-zinc-cadmium efflux system outer membrane protein
MYLARAFPVLVVPTLVCGMLAAVPSPLGLREALQLFRTHGFDALLADEAVALARADELSAGAIPNPSLQASVGRSFGIDTAYAIGLSDSAALSDTLLGKRGLRRDVAAAALRAARLQREEAQRTLELQVAQALVQLAAAEGQLDAARGVAASTARTRGLTERRWRSGVVSEADVARAETAELQSLQSVDVAAQARRAAQLAVAFLLGEREASPDLRADPSLLEFGVPAGLRGADRDALLANAEKVRPDLQSARAQGQRAASAAALAERQRVPDVALSLTYAQEGTGAAAITPPTLTFGVQLPLPLFYRQQGEIGRARSDERTWALQQGKLTAQIAAEVDGALAAFASARERAERSQGRLLERAGRALELVRIQHEKGAASLLDLLDAQRTYAAAAADRITQLAAYWSAAFALLAATGKELSP